jgi:hypothetical protein
VFGVQASQLHDDEEQENQHGEAGVGQVLPLLPEANGAQGRESLKRFRIAECGFRIFEMTADPQAEIRN